MMSDSFYLALCMTALILGAVYWFWTQTQYIQRKVNLLENIVYEMKATLSSGSDGGIGSDKDGGAAALLRPTDYPPAPSSELGEDEDLLHEELTAEADAAAAAAAVTPSVATEAQSAAASADVPAVPAMFAPSGFSTEVSDFDSLDALQPGGVGSGLHDDIPADSSAKPSVLNGMTLKELRRLAEQKGVTVKNHMRKQELIEAILGAAGAPAPVAVATAPAADIKPFEIAEDDA